MKAMLILPNLSLELSTEILFPLISMTDYNGRISYINISTLSFVTYTDNIGEENPYLNLKN